MTRRGRTRSYRLSRGGKVIECGPLASAPVARIWPTETKWATRLIEPVNAKWSAVRSIQYWPTEERAMRRVEEMLRNARLRADHRAGQS